MGVDEVMADLDELGARLSRLLETVQKGERERERLLKDRVEVRKRVEAIIETVDGLISQETGGKGLKKKARKKTKPRATKAQAKASKGGSQ